MDGANDIALLRMCGLGIAYRAQDRVKGAGRRGAGKEKDLAGILPIISGHYGISPPLA